MTFSLDEYSFIQDAKGRKLYYVLRLAKNPESARTLFILHGHQHNAKASGFTDENWNVVCPIDNFGYEQCGAWWLGEDNDFFVKELMLKLIYLVQEVTGSNRLYFWGSSMGGYGAILYGLLTGAEAVFAHIPQIKLRNTKYTDGLPRKFFEKVINDNDFPHWTDLTSLLSITPKSKHPLFFITQTRFDYNRYLEDHTFSFIDTCQKLGSNYFLEIVPKKGHVLYRNIYQSVPFFDMYETEIKEWLEDRQK